MIYRQEHINMEDVLSEMPKFDLRGRYEPPMLVLTNPNREEICVLGMASPPSAQIRFNSTSELTFRVPCPPDGSTASYYRLITKNRLVRVSNLGWFIIVGVQEHDGEDGRYKEITCYSYEYSLNARHVNLIAEDTDNEMTYKFWDDVEPDNTLLGLLLNGTGWSVGYVSTELCGKYRTFELPDDTVYGFLMGSVEEAYECFFLFDTEKMLVHAFSTNDFTIPTDIVFTYDNVLKSVDVEEQTDDIVTAMGIYGSDNMDIRYVNPLGTSVLYDFSYYTNEEWMKPELIVRVNEWTDEVNRQIDDGEFSGYLGEERSLYRELSALQNTAYPYEDIAVSEDFYWSNALKTRVISVDEFLQGGLTQIKTLSVVAETVKSALVTLEDAESKAALEILNKNRANIQTAQSQKEAAISAKKAAIQAVQDSMDSVVRRLKIENYFTESELKELYPFIYEGSYSNENYVITDSMSDADITDMSMELLKQGKNALHKAAQPQYTFSCDTVNFMLSASFREFEEQISLGATIDIEAHRDEWVRPILLEISIDFSSPDSLSLTFGNRFRISNATWEFGELYSDSNKTSNNVNINAATWGKPVHSGLVDRVSAYMENALNVATQQIINSEDQEVSIGGYGILCREKAGDGFSGQQLAIIKNLICMTDDNWATSKLAIGNINGRYSVNAEVLAGNLICGNELVITNETNSFRLDASGATLTNATFSLVSKDGLSQIKINPVDGIRIQTRAATGDAWKNSLYVNSEGTLVAEGDITANKVTATSGSIGGWNISTSGLSNGSNYIYSDGRVKLGALTISGTSSTFEGNVYAKNLQGQLSGSQIANSAISTDKIFSGAITSDKIFGGAVDYSKISSIPADAAVYSGNSYISGSLSGYVNTLVVNKLTAGDLTITGTLNGSVNLNGMGSLKYYSGSSGIWLQPNSGVGLTLGGSGAGLVRISGSSCSIVSSATVNGALTVTGNFTANGTKSAVQKTSSYGKRLLYAYETPENYFADYGEGSVVNGSAVVNIEPIYGETVNTDDRPYYVYLTPKAPGSIYVSEKHADHFVVYGDDIGFDWNIVAKRRGFEDMRLEEYKDEK